MGWLCSWRSSAAFLQVPSLVLVSGSGRKQTALPTWWIYCLEECRVCLGFLLSLSAWLLSNSLAISGRPLCTISHTHTCLTALFLGLPRWAGTRKVKPIWILLKQETVSGSGSGISWATCRSAPLQTGNHASTSPLSFFRLDALPATQTTASKHWRQTVLTILFASKLLTTVFLEKVVYSYSVWAFYTCIVQVWQSVLWSTFTAV